MTSLEINSIIWTLSSNGGMYWAMSSIWVWFWATSSVGISSRMLGRWLLLVTAESYSLTNWSIDFHFYVIFLFVPAARSFPAHEIGTRMYSTFCMYSTLCPLIPSKSKSFELGKVRFDYISWCMHKPILSIRFWRCTFAYSILHK